MSRLFFLYSSLGFLSIFLTLLTNSQWTVINPDAICYLYSAETIGQSGLWQAMHLCPQAKWPFYSILIFFISQFTHLSMLHVAFTLNGLLTAIACLVFVKIVQALGGTERTLWLAVCVILGAHTFNVLRPEIIRDHGFWCFYLMSILWLIYFFNTCQMRYAILWNVSVLLATAFRVEGAFFLLMIPWIVWAMSNWLLSVRLKAFLTLNGLSYFIILIIGVGLSHRHSALGRVDEIMMQGAEGYRLMFQRYHEMTHAIAQFVLPTAALRDTFLITFLVLINAYGVFVINNLSLLYTGLVWYAWIAKVTRFSSASFLVLVGYLMVNIGVTLGFFLENQFLAKRYLVALSLLLMLWVPFALEHLWRQAKRAPVLVSMVIGGWLITAMGGWVQWGPSKTPIRDAGAWLATQVGRHQTLYVNDYQLMYYTQHFGHRIFNVWEQYRLLPKQWPLLLKQYDYVAIVGSQDNKQLQSVTARLPVKIFTPKYRGETVYIYQREKSLS